MSLPHCCGCGQKFLQILAAAEGGCVLVPSLIFNSHCKTEAQKGKEESKLKFSREADAQHSDIAQVISATHWEESHFNGV